MLFDCLNLLPPPEIKEEFISLLSLCIDHNFAQFNHHLHQFPDGLPMGSPISPLMAEIFMDLFEEQLFTSSQPPPHPLLQKILYWHRYVDDVLCAWSGSTSYTNF